MQQSHDIADAYPWVLYVNPAVHFRETQLIKEAQIQNLVLVQDMRKCPTVHSWMNVLPILVDTQKKLAYRGSSCFQQLVKIEIPIEYLPKVPKNTVMWADPEGSKTKNEFSKPSYSINHGGRSVH
jgi:hypothetical protein